MQKLLDETKQKAYIFLREFGFEEDELDPVINKGLRDIEETLIHLSDLLNDEKKDKEGLDGLLHGLKGLLFQLGNHNAAYTVEQLRGTENKNNICKWLDSL